MLTIPSTLDQRIEQLKANAMPGYGGTEINAQNQISNVSAVITNPYDPTTAPPAVGWQWINSLTGDTFVANGIAGAGNWVTPGNGGSGFGLYGWTQDIVYFEFNYRRINWNAGSIFMPDGTVYSISSGNTGNMTTVTYIYLDITISTTVLQITTTASNTVGTGKILLCVATPNSEVSKGAIFQAFGGLGQNVFITATQIAADTITANEIAANTITAGQIAAGTITATEIAATTITAGKMNVTTLSSIQADLGTITAGSLSAVTITGSTITGGTIQTATSGQRVVITGSNNDITFYNSAGDNCGNIRGSTVSSVRAITIGDGSSPTQFIRLWSTAGILLDGGVAVFSNTDILGGANNTYNLGSNATRRQTIYLANGSGAGLNLAQTVTTASLSSNRHIDIVVNGTTYKLLLST